ncbi:hypothetical protein [Rhodosalinus sp.]|uniref:hypothetical protein n=1 Tax=Rhodosalinus sp. TaxID=2047741 RepID=UPI003979A036
MTQTPLFKVDNEQVLDAAIALIPRGRAMQPLEVAAWIGFPISPAGDISSGNVIILNQGRDVRRDAHKLRQHSAFAPQRPRQASPGASALTVP